MAIAYNDTTTNHVGQYTDKTSVFTKTVTASAADQWYITKVAKGNQIVDVKIYADGTASSTVSLGTVTTPALFVSAVSTATSGFFTSNVNCTLDGSGNVTAGLGYRLSADDTLMLTIGGAAVSAKNYVVIVTIRKTY